ncbi:pseudaminic acid biosynthesis-associated methylase [bacterium]|nr:pseudaminic acid biosynthesis-associated methylase [bacterium]
MEPLESTPRLETPQEAFWKNEFGTAYALRNRDLAQARLGFWSKILALTGNLHSVCELGANIGENLQALKGLSPGLDLGAVEINPDAFAVLHTLPGIRAWLGAIQDYQPTRTFDLVFSCGVLIHLNPNDLPGVYQKMLHLSERYVLINEYFNPSPQEIPYRGESERLYKRDFAGEFLDTHCAQVEVVGYGFLWKRLEPAWDNTTWTLFRKR